MREQPLPPAKKGAVVVLPEGLGEFFLAVHDDGSPPGDRLPQGRAGKKEKAQPLAGGLDPDFFTIGEEHQAGVAAFGPIGRKASGTADNIGYGRPAGAGGMAVAASGGEADVKVFGVGGNPGQGPTVLSAIVRILAIMPPSAG